MLILGNNVLHESIRGMLYGPSIMAEWQYKEDAYDALTGFWTLQTLTPLQLVQGMLSLGMRLASPGPQPWL